MSIYINTITSGFFWLVFGTTMFFLFSQTILFDEEHSLVPKENEGDFKLCIMSLFSLIYGLSRFTDVTNEQVNILLFMTFIFISVTCLQMIFI